MGPWDGTEFGGQLARLSTVIQEHTDLNPELAGYVAMGVYDSLLVVCWRQMSDRLGEPSDVDALCPGLGLPRGCLVKILLAAKLVCVADGAVYLPAAWHARPLALQACWREANPQGYASAKRRARTCGNPAKQIVARYRETHPMGGVAKAPPPVGHNELIVYWCEQWRQYEGHGRDYPFTGRDATCVKQLRGATGSLDIARSAIDAYLQCGERWYAGKPLWKLIGNLPQFVPRGEDASRIGANGQHPYRGGLGGLAITSFTPDGDEGDPRDGDEGARSPDEQGAGRPPVAAERTPGQAHRVV